MKSADIILHKKFECFDGFVKHKYLIVLNDPKSEENFLFIFTTSQESYDSGRKKRPTTPGCHCPDSCFFIAQGTEWFPKPTWACFDFRELDKNEVLKREEKGDFQKKSSLSPLRFKLLIDCIKKSQDITQDQINLISESIKIRC